MDYNQTKQTYQLSNSTFKPESIIPTYNPEKVFNQTHRTYMNANLNKLILLSTPVKYSQVALGNLRKNSSSHRRKISTGVMKDFNCENIPSYYLSNTIATVTSTKEAKSHKLNATPSMS